MHSNRLINETSPYLLQHAYNPVDWYPWCEEAFNEAKKQDKPIFLSIGYSACHWCHVMEKESFVDTEVAEHLNRVFINIKVDREERPDIDSLYMTVCQVMTGSGGWPLTIIMTPEKKPFFAATYLPKETSWGKIGLLDLIQNVENIWKTKRSDIEKASESIIYHLKSQEKNESESSKLLQDYLQEVFSSFSFAFDNVNGGFGHAPKFPMSHYFLFLMDYYSLVKGIDAFAMVEKSLSRMRLGGIFDHIGYGFHRYSTDEKWLVPHFEKMLYDQALMLLTYSKAYLLTKNIFYKEVTQEILEYLFNNMCSDYGAFYSSEDADSEGEEGKFYIFSYDELKELLGDEFDLFRKVFNVLPQGNFQTHSQEVGNILHLGEPLENIALHLEVPVAELRDLTKKWRNLIYRYREGRIPPSKDEKILADWNGLMLVGLANAYKLIRSQVLLDFFGNYLFFFKKYFLKGDGTIFHSFVSGKSKIEGMLDDYAFSAWGFWEVYQVTADNEFFDLSIRLFDKAIELFWDNEKGGFFQSPKYNSELIYNPKNFYDGAIPSGNSVMYFMSNVLFKSTGKDKYSRLSDWLADIFVSYVTSNPLAYNFFNFAILQKFYGTIELVFVYTDIRDLEPYLNATFEHYIPGLVMVFKNESLSGENIPNRFWENYRLIGGKTTVYICRNFSCLEPISNFERFVECLKGISSSGNE